MKKILPILVLLAILAYPVAVSANSHGVTDGQTDVKPTECNDGIDNDKDGVRDLDDVDCKKSKDTLKETGTIDKPKVDTTTTTSDFPLTLSLKNPLKVNTIEGAIKKIMDAIMKIAIPIIIILFIWAGFKFIFAQGNKDKLGEARRTFLYTLIGALLVLGAWTIATALVGTVNLITQ
jgi:hypothetical protein